LIDKESKIKSEVLPAKFVLKKEESQKVLVDLKNQNNKEKNEILNDSKEKLKDFKTQNEENKQLLVKDISDPKDDNNKQEVRDNL
jgi:hypothetical protein